MLNLNMEKTLTELINWAVTGGFKIVLILILAFISKKIVNAAFRNFIRLNSQKDISLEYSKKIETIHMLMRSVINFIIMAVAAMLILEEFGINVGPILAAAGVLGIAVGFGSQRFVEDIISGFIILLTDQIRVGDVVQIGDKSGLVEKIDLKMVVLRDISGNVHFIRNGKIDIITNMTKDFSYALFDIGVAYKENVEKVMNIIKEVGEEVMNDAEVKDDILDSIEILGLDKFDDSAVIIRARIKTKPITQWKVGRLFNLKLKSKFDELGIEIPFPHRTVYTVDAK